MPNIVAYKGNYTVTIVDNYSKYIPPKELKENTIFGINIDKNRGIIYFPIIAIIVMAIFIIIYVIKNKYNNDTEYGYNGDSVDIRETAELNK